MGKQKITEKDLERDKERNKDLNKGAFTREKDLERDKNYNLSRTTKQQREHLNKIAAEVRAGKSEKQINDEHHESMMLMMSEQDSADEFNLNN